MHADRFVQKSILATKKGRGLYVYGISQKALHILSKILPTALFTYIMTRSNKNPSNTDISPATEVKAIDSQKEEKVPEITITEPKTIAAEIVVPVEVAEASDSKAAVVSLSPIIEPQNTSETDLAKEILTKYSGK